MMTTLCIEGYELRFKAEPNGTVTMVLRHGGMPLQVSIPKEEVLNLFIWFMENLGLYVGESVHCEEADQVPQLYGPREIVAEVVQWCKQQRN